MRESRRKDSWCGPRRLRIAAWIGLFLWGIVIARLVHIQGFLGEAYAERAYGQYVRQTSLSAKRGSLLDRRGTEMATDVKARSFYARPEHVQDPEAVANFFARLNGVNSEKIVGQLSGARSFVYLARQVDTAAVDARADSFAGVYSHGATRRFYPLGSLAGQLLGHTNIDNEGREGVERAFDSVLRETEGAQVAFVDARGLQVPGSIQQQAAAKNGHSVVLTIDALYQSILEEELARTIEEADATSAMGVIIDPTTGEILALANVPLFDPNHSGRSTALQRRNRVIADAYEPGSTFKVIAAAAVLEDGLAQVDEQVHCEDGLLTLSNGDLIRDITPHGNLTFAEVIEQSSNIGVIKFARRMPRARYYQYIRSFGFATRSGVELPAESSGILQRVGRWSDRSQETISIGQEISVTVLQLAQAYAVIANGGELLVPQIVKGYADREGGLLGEEKSPRVLRRVVSEKTAAILREILQGVVDRGTGNRAQIAGVSVAGKTGTAQKAAENGLGYDPDASIVSFAGFLPVEKPQYVCVIVVDDPRKERWGGSVAAPAFQRVMQRIIHLPGGLLADRPMGGNLVSTRIVPDLRGMTRSAAYLTAQLRGIEVQAEGQGSVVVGQVPQPGEEILVGVDIRCQLGEDVSHLNDVKALEGRQMRLLEVLEQEFNSPARGL